MHTTMPRWEPMATVSSSAARLTHLSSSPGTCHSAEYELRMDTLYRENKQNKQKPAKCHNLWPLLLHKRHMYKKHTNWYVNYPVLCTKDFPVWSCHKPTFNSWHRKLLRTNQLNGNNACGPNGGEGGEGSALYESLCCQHHQELIISKITNRQHRRDSLPRWHWQDLSISKTSGISNTFEDPRYEDIMSTDPYEYLKCLTHLQKYRIIQKSKPADIEDSGAT